MKHYGDITKINGSKVELVDVVTGGSPCQDLSVAGKRAGLDGERSGLFMEQIRIIKEMRDESVRRLRASGTDFNIRDIRPRYMVWENVAGAFSSNKGEDFRIVLEETARVVDSNAIIPGLEGGQKWSHSGCILGEGWSIAWRLHDAQFWGVPQRRKRISLVADFGGQSAPEILFERNGLSGNTEQSRTERKEVARTVEGSPETASYTLKIRGGREIDSYGKRAGKGALIQTEKSATLGVNQDQTLMVVSKKDDTYQKVTGTLSPGAKGWYNGQDAYNDMFIVDKTSYSVDGYNQTQEEVAQTLRAKNNDSDHIPLTYSMDKHNIAVTEEKTQTLIQGEKNKDVPCVAYGLDRASFNQGKNAKFDFSVDEEVSPTIVSKGPGGVLKA